MSKSLSFTDQLSEADDQKLWTVESVADDLEQHLMREARQAQRLSKTAQITLNPTSIQRMKQNLTKLEDKWAYFEPRSNFLAEHNALPEPLVLALETLEQSTQQVSMALQDSMTLTEVRKQIANQVEAIQFQIEALDQGESKLSADEQDKLLDQFFDEYETIAETFETLESKGLNIRALMRFYNDMSKKLEALQQMVDGAKD